MECLGKETGTESWGETRGESRVRRKGKLGLIGQGDWEPGRETRRENWESVGGKELRLGIGGNWGWLDKETGTENEQG